MFRKMLLIALAALVSSACTTATARPLVDISVVDRDSGQWLPKYPYRGDTWVAGTPGIFVADAEVEIAFPFLAGFFNQLRKYEIECVELVAFFV